MAWNFQADQIVVRNVEEAISLFEESFAAIGYSFLGSFTYGTAQYRCLHAAFGLPTPYHETIYLSQHESARPMNGRTVRPRRIRLEAATQSAVIGFYYAALRNGATARVPPGDMPAEVSFHAVVGDHDGNEIAVIFNRSSYHTWQIPVPFWVAQDHQDRTVQQRRQENVANSGRMRQTNRLTVQHPEDRQPSPRLTRRGSYARWIERQRTPSPSIESTRSRSSSRSRNSRRSGSRSRGGFWSSAWRIATSIPREIGRELGFGRRPRSRR